jgi:hypothetical protein
MSAKQDFSFAKSRPKDYIEMGKGLNFAGGEFVPG